MKLSAVKGALSILLAASVLGGCSQNPDGLTPVTLNEVAHSIFYWSFSGTRSTASASSTPSPAR